MLKDACLKDKKVSGSLIIEEHLIQPSLLETHGFEHPNHILHMVLKKEMDVLILASFS